MKSSAILVLSLVIFPFSSYAVEKESSDKSIFYISNVAELNRAIKALGEFDNLAISDKFYTGRSLAEQNTIKGLVNRVSGRGKSVMVYGNNVNRENLKSLLGLDVLGDSTLSFGWINRTKESSGTASWPKSDLSEEDLRKYVEWVFEDLATN